VVALSEQTGAAVGRVPPLTERLAVRERPAQRRLGAQRWSGLLFAHWKVDPAAVQATLPRGLQVDTCDGHAFVGVVPFFMARVRPVGLPPVPWLSWFLELNVRTYVHDERGTPGVWFYSLDCNQPVAVEIAQRFFHLPYRHARMAAESTGADVVYRCRRRGAADAWEYRWRAAEAGAEAQPGTLEFFLVERYVLFAADARSGLYAGRVHHAPYRVSVPGLERWTAGPVQAAGFRVDGPPVSVLGAAPVDVSIFPLQRI
jgi:hypothetical protein